MAVNVNAPMNSGAIHVDVPSFRGADRDRYPMRLLQAMAASGLFEDWRVAEAGAVWWSYHGRGGAPPALSAAAQIGHYGDSGWTITDTGRTPVRYDDRDIRISILWKARVRPGPESTAAAPLTPELITEIIAADLTRRGVQAAGRMPSLSDRCWLDLVHTTAGNGALSPRHDLQVGDRTTMYDADNPVAAVVIGSTGPTGSKRWYFTTAPS